MVMELEGTVQNGEVVVDRPELLPEGARVRILVHAPATALRAAWAEVMAQMGIRGEPIPAEDLRAMIAACGCKPENNEFSRGIVQMREE
jgi:hypothetical protein